MGFTGFRTEGHFQAANILRDGLMEDQIESTKLALEEIGLREKDVGHHRRFIKLCRHGDDGGNLLEGFDEDLTVGNGSDKNQSKPEPKSGKMSCYLRFMPEAHRNLRYEVHILLKFPI